MADLKLKTASGSAPNNLSYATLGIANNKLYYGNSSNVPICLQEELVSGTNIKTINGVSIIGSGNINISGGGGDVTSAGDNVFTGVNIFKVPNTFGTSATVAEGVTFLPKTRSPGQEYIKIGFDNLYPAIKARDTANMEDVTLLLPTSKPTGTYTIATTEDARPTSLSFSMDAGTVTGMPWFYIDLTARSNSKIKKIEEFVEIGTKYLMNVTWYADRTQIGSPSATFQASSVVEFAKASDNGLNFSSTYSALGLFTVITNTGSSTFTTTNYKFRFVCNSATRLIMSDVSLQSSFIETYKLVSSPYITFTKIAE